MRCPCNSIASMAVVWRTRLVGLMLVALATLCPPATEAGKKQQQQPAPKPMMKIGDEIVSVEAGNTFVKAQELMNSSQFDQAGLLLKQFLESYPDSTAAHYKYGFALLQQGKNVEAFEQATRCTQLKPNFFGGWALLGEASENLKFNEQAKVAYAKALAIQSTGENADIIREHLNDLSKSKEDVKPTATRAEQEVAAQNRAIMKLNKGLSLCNQANDLLKQKQFEPGLQKCRSALRIAPDSEQVRENVVVYLNNYGADCVQKQNLTQAEALMKEAIALQTKGGCTVATQMTTFRNYTALLKFVGRNDEARKIEEQMKAVAVPKP